MTAGHVCCTDPKESLSYYIRQADSMLYHRKRVARIGR